MGGIGLAALVLVLLVALVLLQVRRRLRGAPFSGILGTPPSGGVGGGATSGAGASKQGAASGRAAVEDPVGWGEGDETAALVPQVTTRPAAALESGHRRLPRGAPQPVQTRRAGADPRGPTLDPAARPGARAGPAKAAAPVRTAGGGLGSASDSEEDGLGLGLGEAITLELASGGPSGVGAGGVLLEAQRRGGGKGGAQGRAPSPLLGSGLPPVKGSAPRDGSARDRTPFLPVHVHVARR